MTTPGRSSASLRRHRRGRCRKFWWKSVSPGKSGSTPMSGSWKPRIGQGGIFSIWRRLELSFETRARARSSEPDRKSDQCFQASANSLKLIHFLSWPGLSRPSTSFLLLGCKDVDARHKAGHDELDANVRFYWSLFESDSQDEGFTYRPHPEERPLGHVSKDGAT
ncbi:MAG: hypothetical protein JWR80_4580 [Bradyrhizobium sp.]|nr:hypothetical protein [Bradyrhizobium sp.]